MTESGRRAPLSVCVPGDPSRVVSVAKQASAELPIGRPIILYTSDTAGPLVVFLKSSSDVDFAFLLRYEGETACNGRLALLCSYGINRPLTSQFS